MSSEAKDEIGDIPTAAMLRSQLRDEVSRLRNENGRLREALESLLDEQNGPPLYTREAQWNEAVSKAQQALSNGS